MRKPLAMAAATVIAAIATGTAHAEISKRQQIQQQRARYYHADGFIKAIGRNARRTQYSSDPRTRRNWTRRLRRLERARADAQSKLQALLHPRPAVDVAAWQQTVDCENGGSWPDSPGYYYLGLQFDPGTWATAASHTGVWGTSPQDQVINAIWTARHASRDPWPNCPDPYFG